MHIDVSREGPAPAVSLIDPRDFTSFKIVINAMSRDEAAAALAGIAVFNAHDKAHASVDALRTMSECADDSSWVEGFEAMLRYAESAGWTSRPGHVDAHCEWVDEVAR
jgi:hypothetical protein